jgi:hypothetical protein
MLNVPLFYPITRDWCNEIKLLLCAVKHRAIKIYMGAELQLRAMLVTALDR